MSLLVVLLGCSGNTEPPADTATEDTAAPVPVDDPTMGAIDIQLTPHAEIGSLSYAGWLQAGELVGVIEFGFEDEWLTTPEFSVSDGHQAFVLLLGVPFETDFTWRFVGTLDGEAITGADHTARTGDLPAGLPEATVLVSDPGVWVSEDRYLMSSINEDAGGWTGGSYWKFMIDRQGRYVWAMETPQSNWSIFLRISYDGDDILWDEATYWSKYDTGEASQVHRMKIDGTIIESTPTPGLHHAFTELSDGTLVWGSADWNSEELVKRAPGGEVERIWGCQDAFSADYCQSNTLYWHEPTDTFLYSFYTNSSVVQIDHATGQTLYYWGQNPAWGFDPAETQFSWQHGVNILENGHLLLSTHTTVGDLETVAREYEIDDKTKSLREVWSFGVGEGVHADTAGEAHRLANGNTLHNYGSNGSLREVTSDGELVWEVEWPGNRLLGRSVFLEDLYTFAQ